MFNIQLEESASLMTVKYYLGVSSENWLPACQSCSSPSGWEVS